MSDDFSTKPLAKKIGDLLPAAASEMNNLLQIIAGTVKLLEKIWDGDPRAGKYFEMLHLQHGPRDRSDEPAG
ncbi:MAG: hypothetical protein M3Q86_01565 [Verrucomicrobiota bacterium]|nr:hypothetical protein [Verrucomicrobiota bacterium]